MDERIDFSRFTGTGESEEVIRKLDPRRELRSPSEKERAPDYFQRSQEREGNSTWSGGQHGRRNNFRKVEVNNDEQLLAETF